MNAPTDLVKTTVFKLDAETIGARIRARRKQRRETQLQVGKACGVSQNGVMKIEHGQTENSRFVTAIWSYLGIAMAGVTGFTIFAAKLLAMAGINVPPIALFAICVAGAWFCV